MWKDVPDYEGYYQISDDGCIISTDRKVASKSGSVRVAPSTVRVQIQTPNGYRQVILHKEGKRTRFLVHRLVLMVFCGEPTGERCYANHKNGDKADNRIENLEWVTLGENMIHARDNLNWRHYSGEKNPAAKLSNRDIEEIRKLGKKGVFHRVIAEMFSVSQPHISRIIRGEQRKGD